jgi:alkylation response protein AidB-like acyl-CoA dehydrogenase
MSVLPDELRRWLSARADALDAAPAEAEPLVPQLAAYGLFGVGVPESLGGSGGRIGDAVARLSALAELSVTAAFVYWSQRTFIEYVLATPLASWRERWLGPLLAGEVAGATGLSNAMKFLAGIEELQVGVSRGSGGLLLDGVAPWVTNLRRSGFMVAVAVRAPEGDAPWIVALPGGRAGVQRSADLRLLGLGASDTAALRFERVSIDSSDVLHADGRVFIGGVRPAFLGLQCGLALGLARASVRLATELAAGRTASLASRVRALSERLEAQAQLLEDGLADGRFTGSPAELFTIRIRLARLAQEAVELELAASGGRAYLADLDRGFARRWREVAFLPILTPSLVQLEQELARCGAGAPP